MKETKTARILTGYDGWHYKVGDRVELHPGCDLWMRGARFGVVVGSSVTSGDRVRFTLDATGSKVWTASEDRLRLAK